MFENVAAHLLNKYLGRYVQDLDSQNLAVGIFGGTVQLTDLQLKTEALYELDLPIEVKAGCIGRLSIDIPWSSLYSDPVLVHVEDVLILSGPSADRGFDQELDKRLARALKKKRLDDAQEPSLHQDLVDKPRSFFENLVATIVNNIQVSVQNVHIRYEDSVSVSGPGGGSLCCGLALQGFTAITTNCKWKPTQVDGEAHRIFKLVKAESLSMYWNPDCSPQGLVKSMLPSPHWKVAMKRGLATFSVGSQEFDFVVKPISAKAKVIFNKTAEEKVPKLLVDFVLQDAALQLSRQQYLSMVCLQESFQLLDVAQRYRRFRGPCAPATSRQWWAFAYVCVLEDRIRPFSWSRIKEHRARYRWYRSLYVQHLRRPTDSEVKLDLQKAEDSLDLVSILVARVQAKVQISSECLESDPPCRNGGSLGSGGWAWWLSRFLGPWTLPLEDEGEQQQCRHWRWEQERPLWERLSEDERRTLEEAIGLTEGSAPGQGAEASANYIAHKINFTLANCTASLVVGEAEILVLTLTQFLSSLETRPGAGGAFKISARAESFVVEGASPENDLLVPVVTADNAASGSALTHVFGLDFEKNPLHVNADFGLCINAEPIEVVYHEYAVSQVLGFFQVPEFGRLQQAALQGLKDLAHWSKAGLQYALSKHKTLHLSVDFKSPYLVIPEHGTIQKGGSVLVVDMGRLTVRSDLQPTANIPEEASRMDIEEQLYDRFSVNLADIQILFSDSGDEWRSAKQTPESDMHLMPKVRIQLLYSCSVKSDYRLLPSQKLNISVPSLKLCLSDRRLRLLVEFAQNLPLPNPGTNQDYELDNALTVLAPVKFLYSCSEPPDFLDIPLEPHGEELRRIRWSVLAVPPAGAFKNSRSSTDASLPGSVQNFPSESSDEDPEEWARTVDLPGFDDNVSPSNSISMLFRFVLGEIVLHLSRSSDHADKPYLMLRMDKLCADAALMDYGPAVQASLGGLQIIDKLHTGPSGEYLELLKSESKNEMFTLLYRKVQANCPEFRSHFHQVEHSLVLDLSSVSVVFHRAAFITLARFLLYISERLKPLASEEVYSQLVPEVCLAPSSLVAAGDPPVPSGATKFSISARLGQLKVKVCDTDFDLADITVAGLECDYILKANDKMIVRLNLTDLTVEDLAEGTLYPKVMSIEDDRVFEFKYVKHSPWREVDSVEDPCRPDGALRLHVGRLQVVYLHRFCAELQRFLDPFLQPQATVAVLKKAETTVHRQLNDLQARGSKLTLSVEVHAPTLVIPQKSSSPNLLLLGLGDLSLENLFKEQNNQGSPGAVQDNLLLRLTSLQLTRAIVLLDGSIECQEPILEPVKLRLDIKRALNPAREGLAYDIRGSLDLIKVCIGQRDISTFLAIYKENLGETDLSPFTPAGSGSGSPVTPEPCNGGSGVIGEEEGSFRRLEAFLAAGAEVKKWGSLRFNMEGLQVALYTDSEEVLSSPVRDPTRSLSLFTLEEVGVQWEGNSDGSCEWTLSLQSLLLEDTRPDSALALKRILHSYSSGDTGCSGICISTPPVLDLTYKFSAQYDATVNVTMDRTRLNLSVPYTLAVLKFLHDSLPGSHRPCHPTPACEEDEEFADDVLVEYGQGRTAQTVPGPQPGRPPFPYAQRCRLPSDSTSGYHSTHGGVKHSDSAYPGSGCPSLNISACLKKPEVAIFADPTDPNSQVILVKTDVLMELNRTSSGEHAVLSVAGLHIMSCAYRNKKDTMKLVLKPCDVELSRTRKFSEEEEEVKINFSFLSFRLSAPVLTTMLTILQDYQNEIQTHLDLGGPLEFHEEDVSLEKLDLWSTKNITPARWLRPPSVLVSRPSYPHGRRVSQILSIHLPELSVNLEAGLPLIFLRVALEANLHDWSNEVYMKSVLHMEAMYYNEKLLTWEPLLEPVLEGDSNYRPFQLHLKMFRGRGHPIAVRRDTGGDIAFDVVDASAEEAVSVGGVTVTGPGAVRIESSAESSSDGEDENTVIRPRRSRLSVGARMASQRSQESCCMSACPPDSDSETEDNLLEKITTAFGHLFSGESSDDEEEEGVHGGGETSDDAHGQEEDEALEDMDLKTEDEEEEDQRPVFLIPNHTGKGEDTVDGTVEVDCTVRSQESSLYWVVEASDPFNLNLSSRAIAVLWEVTELLGGGGGKSGPELLNGDATGKSLVLHNYLGPCTKMVILMKEETTGKYVVLEEAAGGCSPDSPPGGVTLEELDEDEPQLLVDVGVAVNSAFNDDPYELCDDADGFSVISAMSGASSGRGGTGGGVGGTVEPASAASSGRDGDVADLYCRSLKERISIEVDGFEKFQCLVPTQAGLTLFSLHPCKNKTRYYFLIDADTDHGLKSITVRSPLQIENHLSRPMQVFCQKSSLEAVGACVDDFARNPFHAQHVQLATLEADQSYCLPLLVAYHCPLFFQPAPTPADMQGYEVSRDGVWWQDIEALQRQAKFLHCPSRTHAKSDFWIKVVCLEERKGKPVGSSKMVPNYTLHLYPPVTLQNDLPYGIEVMIPRTGQQLRLEESESIPLYDVHPQNSQEIKIELPQYQGVSWHGRLEVSGQGVDHRTLSLTATPDSGRRLAQAPPPLSICIHSMQERSLDVHLYSPYWLLNKTSLPLQAKGSATDVVFDLSPSLEPVLFRYKKHRSKKVKVRAYNTSKWSPSFSLDALGHQGVLVCKDKERKKKYQFFTSIQGCRFALSKAVTFQPFFNVANHTKHDLRFMEENEAADFWMDLPAGQSLSYWPDTSSMRLFLKYRESKIVSQHFSIDKSHSTVLRMDHGTALTVEVSGGQESPIWIRFLSYSTGDAPVRVENLCEDLFIKINQKSLGQVTLLNPYQSVMYTWDDPTAERTLVWDLYNRKKEGFHALISRDGCGQERLSFRTLRRTPTVIQKRSSLDYSSSDDDNSEEELDPLLPRRTRRDKVVVYWVSYLDSSRQRSLLFTQDERVASQAKKSVSEEASQNEMFVSLSFVGLSLVGPTREVAYLSCSGSPPSWEVEVNRSWKLLTLELSAWLEDKWVAGQVRADLKDRVQVDLSRMQMLKPFFGALRRTSQPALWVQGRRSKHHRFLHLRLHRLQVDNQLPEAVFPTVLSPLATPQAILRRMGPRPFLELQLFTHHQPRMDTVKYCKVLVQEMSLKVDRGFLLSVTDILSWEPDRLKEVQFPPPEAQRPLRSERIVFEYLHLSPIKLHLSFSPRGMVHGSEPSSDGLFWSSLGAAMTEVKDVQIKLAYFERRGVVSSIGQLETEAWRHYLGQGIQQAHVLLLGLDVLGNPYGLVRDFTRGFRDVFYEPYLGRIQSPEEFSNGLADGARCLLGHVVGGSVGVVALVAESLAQVLSSLSCDQDYRKKRQRRLRQHRDSAGSLPEGLALAGRGLAQGVALGISGILLQPVAGAQQEGLEGFFKGAGKGILGLLTKPAGGVLDLVAMAFDSVRRAAEMGEQVVVQMRLPRYTNSSQGLRPYSPYQALGQRLLQSLSRGHYAETDVYWAHAALTADPQAEVVLLTDRHLFLLEPRRGWARWDVQWVVRTDELVSVPVLTGNRMTISVREEDSLRTGPESGVSQRSLHCRDAAILAWLRSQVERVLLANMQGRPCAQCV